MKNYPINPEMIQRKKNRAHLPIYFLLAILAMGGYSCETDVEIPIDYTEPKMVVNSVFGTDDTAKVWVTASKYILDQKPIESIDDAQVEVRNSQGDVWILEHDNDGWYLNPLWQIMPGETYELTVEHPSYVPVSAWNQVPEAPLFNAIGFGNWITVMEDGWDYRYREVEVRFNDPQGSDFYLLKFTMLSPRIDWDYQNNTDGDTVWEEYPVELRTMNSEGGLDAYDFRSSFLINDVLFDGGECVFSALMDEYYFQGNDGDQHLRVYLHRISEAYYYYASSLENYQETGDFFFFSQPVQVYTNIENGLGIFAGYSAVNDSIKIEKIPWDK